MRLTFVRQNFVKIFPRIFMFTADLLNVKFSWPFLGGGKIQRILTARFKAP